MGWGIYLKNYIDKYGKSKMYFRITSVNGVIKKTIPNIKIYPKNFDKKRSLISNNEDLSFQLNNSLNDIIKLLNSGWNKFESGVLTWDDLRNFVCGNLNEIDLVSFIEKILINEYEPSIYKGIKDAYGSAKKTYGRDLQFSDLNEYGMNKLVKRWKTLRSTTLKTYKYHFSLILKSAFNKRLISYEFKSLKKWRMNNDKLTRYGNPYVETIRPEDFKIALNKCKTLISIEAMGFWLLSFGTRGLYPSDFCSIHKYKWELITNYPKYGNSLIFHHIRHKTNEPMWILFPHTFVMLQKKLRMLMKLTHPNETTTDENKGWFFKNYDKNNWGVFSKNLNKIGFKSLNTARKTFETVGLTLNINEDIRNRLLGHQVHGIKRFYQNWEWTELQEKIHDSHIKILEKFDVEELFNEFNNKANEILKGMGVDVEEFNDKYKC